VNLPMTSEPARLRYQSHIDGLRAVAVVAVILFHAHVPFMAGGQLGVDIFFVISGYLITALVTRAIAAGTFSLGAFYVRRARRILPALAVVLLSSSLAAWVLLSPHAFKDYLHTALANVGFASNLLFAREADYFSSQAELKPLIHTWSLAVEEQFYLIFPALLLWLTRRRINMVWVLGLLAVLSYGGSVVLGRVLPDLSFYLMPTRGWELLAGALGALLLARAQGTPRLARLTTYADAWFVGGLLLVLMSLVAPGRFPGAFSVAAVLGAALVIMAGGQSRLGSLLGAAPLRLTGQMSYSLYLWHQPVFAFLRAYLPRPLAWPEYLAGILLTVVLAVLTWRSIEVPSRSASRVPLRRLGALVGTAALGVAGLAVAGQLAGGWPSRFSPAAIRATRAEDDRDPRGVACRLTIQDHRPPAQGCLYGAQKPEADVILAGDSHAGVLAGNLGQLLQPRGLTLRSLTVVACPPLLLEPSSALKLDALESGCVQRQREIAAYIVQSSARTVVLLARWSLYTQGTVLTPGEGTEASDGPGNFVRAQVPEAVMVQGYVAFIRRLTAAGKSVILVDPVPELGWHVPDTLFKKAAFGQHTAVSLSYASYRTRHRAVLAAFDALRDPQVQVVQPATLLCDPAGRAVCVSEQGGRVLYFDDDHLTLSGAQPVAEQVNALIAQDVSPVLSTRQR
jgi:peptidoglycan/LPS O-acetylase OafA/YrhL